MTPARVAVLDDMIVSSLTMRLSVGECQLYVSFIRPMLRWVARQGTLHDTLQRVQNVCLRGSCPLRDG